MRGLLKKVKNHFGFDAPGDIYFRHLIYPRRFFNVCKYVIYKNKRTVHVPYYPITLMVEVSTKCNLQCPGCERELYKSDPKTGGIPKENVGVENFKKLEKVLPYVYSAYFVGGLGEPFMNKEFWDIHRYFKGFKVMTGYISNGMLITEADVKKTIEENVNRVMISIDSHIKGKYESIKKGADFEKAADVVRLFARRKIELNAHRFQIGLNYILRSDNYEDAVDYLDFARSLGAEYIMFTSFITHIEEQMDKPFFLVDDGEKERLYKTLREKAKRLGLSIRLPNIAPSKGAMCNCLWHGVCIFYNGEVSACPFFRTKRDFYYHVDKDYKVVREKKRCEDTVLGNYMPGEFFSGIWNGEKARAMRKAVLKDDFDFNPCGACYYKYDLH
ncbi:MAG: radical SAM protein [Deltaproteobacteria bacterium]|nr:radical SAM protein [Deltaproteobacteria bacterium]